MLRGLILLVLVGGMVLITAPFLLTSLATDDQGIVITGRVVSKSEAVTVRHSDWTRTAEISIEYAAPDEPGPSFFKVSPTVQAYDSLHVGDSVRVRYLKHRDIPAVPGAHMLEEVHALPVARLAEHRTFTRFGALFSGRVVSILTTVGGIAMILVVLRLTGSPLSKWGAGAAVLGGLAVLFYSNFPRPTPAPRIAVRQAMGTVQSIDRITRFWEGNRSEGFEADQPADVVGVRFMPAGRTDPVLAVDLIDADSVSGLVEGSKIRVEYEAGTPRTAYIVGARREFPARNLKGMVVEIVLSLVLLAACVFGASWVGKAFNRLVARRAGSGGAT